MQGDRVCRIDAGDADRSARGRTHIRADAAPRTRSQDDLVPCLPQLLGDLLTDPACTYDDCLHGSS
jgi:hypothetical protein